MKKGGGDPSEEHTALAFPWQYSPQKNLAVTIPTEKG